ncbi:hypothetical protein ACQ4PT_045902 [Festuca glaucescens]
MRNLTLGIRAIPPHFPPNFSLDLASIIETCSQKLARELSESAMDESVKELLKHIQGLIKDSATGVTTKLCTDFRTRSDAVEHTIEALSNDFHAWKPHLESRVNELQAAVIELHQHATLKQPLGVSTVTNSGDPAAAHLADACGLDVFPIMGKRPSGTNLEQGHGEPSVHPGAALGGAIYPGQGLEELYSGSGDGSEAT